MPPGRMEPGAAAMGYYQEPFAGAVQPVLPPAVAGISPLEASISAHLFAAPGAYHPYGLQALAAHTGTICGESHQSPGRLPQPDAPAAAATRQPRRVTWMTPTAVQPAALRGSQPAAAVAAAAPAATPDAATAHWPALPTAPAVAAAATAAVPPARTPPSLVVTPAAVAEPSSPDGSSASSDGSPRQQGTRRSPRATKGRQAAHPRHLTSGSARPKDKRQHHGRWSKPPSPPPPQQQNPPPASRRRPNKPEPYLPAVDTTSPRAQPPQAQQHVPPAERHRKPQLPAFELPQLTDAGAEPAGQRSTAELLRRNNGIFKVGQGFTLADLAEVCSNPDAVRAYAALAASPAAATAAVPATYAAALLTTPAAARPAAAPALAPTSGFIMVGHTSTPPLAAAQPAQPGQPEVVTLNKPMGSMPYFLGNIITGQPPFKNTVRLHMDTGAGISCIKQATADKVLPLMTSKGARRAKLARPLAIQVVGHEVTYAHEVLLGAKFKVGKAMITLDMLIVPHMPVDYLIGMDCIPLHNMSADWRSSIMHMDLHGDALAPGEVLSRDKLGRPYYKQHVQLYIQYGSMAWPCVKP